MPTSYKHCTVRILRVHHERIVLLAADQKCTPSDIIRFAVDQYLAGGSWLTESSRRLARICEYQHLALDIIIREQFSDYRDRLIAETDRRMAQYHGA